MTIDLKQTINFNNRNAGRKVVVNPQPDPTLMSLQSIAASVPTRRLQGVRRFTVPLFVALSAVALYNAAAATGVHDAIAMAVAVH
jgi:hypothetical protein